MQFIKLKSLKEVLENKKRQHSSDNYLLTVVDDRETYWAILQQYFESHINTPTDQQEQSAIRVNSFKKLKA